DADAAFERLARAVLDDLLERHPEVATDLGDHRFDDRLSDPRPEALEDERRAVSAHLSNLAAIDASRLGQTNRVDAEILGSRLRERSEEHTSELQSQCNLVCGVLLDEQKPRNLLSELVARCASHVSAERMSFPLLSAVAA